MRKFVVAAVAAVVALFPQPQPLRLFVKMFVDPGKGGTTLQIWLLIFPKLLFSDGLRKVYCYSILMLVWLKFAVWKSVIGPLVRCYEIACFDAL